MKTTSILMGLAGIMATTLVAAEVQNYATTGTSDQSPQTLVDAQGNLRVPDDYRTAYQFLGANRRGTRQRFATAPRRLCVARHDRRLSQRWEFSRRLRVGEGGV